MTLRMEQVFVRKLSTVKLLDVVRKKIELGESLTEQELMKLIILPLAEKGNKNKQKRIIQVIEIADMINNEQDQKLVISGLLVVSDKFINREDAEKIRRKFAMTKVFQIFEEEKQEAIKESLNREREEGMLEGQKKEKIKVAEKLIRKGNDIKTIIEITDLLEEEIRDIEEKILIMK